MDLLLQFNIHDMFTAAIVLVAIIDILGSAPLIVSLRAKGFSVSAPKCTIISLCILLLFYFAGNAILKIFNVDITYFAVAGSLLLLFMALEMILDIEIFQNNGPTKEASLIPLVFPLVAGPGAIAAVLSLKSMYADINIIVALLINMAWVYLVIKVTEKIRGFVGDSGIYFMRRFFGMILLAIAVKIFSDNLTELLRNF